MDSGRPDSGDLRSACFVAERPQLAVQRLLHADLRLPGRGAQDDFAGRLAPEREDDGDDAGDAVRRYLSDPSSSPSKVEFLQKVATTNCIDSIIPYLNDCIDILSSESIDDDQVYQVARLVLMRSKVIRNLPLKDEELKEVKEILRGSHGNRQ